MDDNQSDAACCPENVLDEMQSLQPCRSDVPAAVTVFQARAENLLALQLRCASCSGGLCFYLITNSKANGQCFRPGQRTF